MNPVLGVIFHGIGGAAAGTFYLPLKGVKQWAWESAWLVAGVFSWIIAPWCFALYLNPRLGEALVHAPGSALVLTLLFGMLWGVGGLTFGLSMRYLGLSLGYAVTLGFCAAFGTLIPPLFKGEFPQLLTSRGGWIVLVGVLICLAGIALSGRSGILRDQEQGGSLPAEFNLVKGLWVAMFSGIMSSCMAFAFQSGKPIMDLATETGTPKVYANTAVLVVILLGGFATNALWCLVLNFRNRSFGDYLNRRQEKAPLVRNYTLSALAGVTWYLQFFFYSMGTTLMGPFDFSSWTLHMAFIILCGNFWGLILGEWRNTSGTARSWLAVGVATLLVSIMLVGWGNALGT